MKERILPIFLGFILTLLVIVGAIFFFSRPDRFEANLQEFTGAENDVEELKQAVKELDNFGNLPQSTDAGVQGGSNPFDPY